MPSCRRALARLRRMPSDQEEEERGAGKGEEEGDVQQGLRYTHHTTDACDTVGDFFALALAPQTVDKCRSETMCLLPAGSSKN